MARSDCPERETGQIPDRRSPQVEYSSVQVRLFVCRANEHPRIASGSKSRSVALALAFDVAHMKRLVDEKTSTNRHTLSVLKYVSAVVANVSDRLGPRGRIRASSLESVCGSASNDMPSDASSINRTIFCVPPSVSFPATFAKTPNPLAQLGPVPLSVSHSVHSPRSSLQFPSSISPQRSVRQSRSGSKGYIDEKDFYRRPKSLRQRS